jgi:hypothetical protein
MNKAAERKSAVARQHAEEQLGLKRKAEAVLRSEKDEEHQLQVAKTERLRGLRLEREAALRSAAASMPVGRAKRKK